MIHVDYTQSTIGQRSIAVLGNFFGGAIIIVLGILGAFFDYDSLIKYGFDLITIPCYAVVVLSSVLILMRAKYGVLIAIAAELIEMLVYITHQVTSSPDVSFLILLKIAVIVCSTQLAMKIITFSDDPEPPKRPQRQMPQVPQGRQLPQRPVNRNRRR